MSHDARLVQEPDLVPGRSIAWISFGVVAAILLGAGVAWGIGQCTSHELGGAGIQPLEPATVPSEVSAIETTLFTVRAQGLEDKQAAQAWLESYGWVDQEAQTIHVPIDVAMRLWLSQQPAPAEPVR